MAAKLRSELSTEVDMIHGNYGEFSVLVDGKPVIEAGLLSAVGILPSGRKVLEAVRKRMGEPRPA